MFNKILRIGVILWAGSLPAESGAPRFPWIDSFGDTGQISYRLPNNTKPETYHISLRTGISEGLFDYDGIIAINILVVNATREVTLHSQDLNIKSIHLSNASTTIDLLPWRSSNVTDFLVIPTKSVELLPGSRFTLEIKFASDLLEIAKGFFRQQYDRNTTKQR